MKHSIINQILKNNEYNLPKNELLISILLEFFERKNIINFKEYQSLLSNNNINFTKFQHKNILYQKELKDLENIKPKELILIAEKFLKERESTGSYYTPKYLVDFMIYDSFRNYLDINTDIERYKIENFLKFHDISEMCYEELMELFFLLKKIKVIDIACGSGIFLIHIFYKLFNLISILSIHTNNFISEFQIKYNILNHNIYGIDIQEFPLQILIIALIKDFSKYDEFKLEQLSFNIFQKDSIMGDQIYKNKEIAEISKKGGFDIVIGNPPYIGEKGNKSLFQKIKEFEFGKVYYEAKMDLFYYFIYRGIELLKPKGILTYITTNYFITADGANKLRDFLRKKTTLKTIINFNEINIFNDARGQHNMIFTAIKASNYKQSTDIIYYNRKCPNEVVNSILNSPETKTEYCTCYTMNHSQLFGNNGNIILYSNKSYISIINKIETNSDTYLGDICYINQGLVSGADRVNKRILQKKVNNLNRNYCIGEGIYVLRDYEIIEKGLHLCKNIKPFYKNSDIKKYFTKKETEQFILYLNDSNIDEENYCPAIKHLLNFKTVLEKRREVVKGVRKWYALQWYRNYKIFERHKIVVPQRSIINSFGYSEVPWYASADVYYITAEDKVNLKFILGILNSKLVYFWLYNKGKRKGDYLELYAKPLSQIPLKIKISKEIKGKIISIVDNILMECNGKFDLKSVNNHQDKIDLLLYDLYGFSDEEIQLIEDLYKRTANIK